MLSNISCIVFLNMVSICENQDQFKLSKLLQNIQTGFVLNDVLELNSDLKINIFSDGVETNGPNLTSTNVLSLKVMSGLKLS